MAGIPSGLGNWVDGARFFNRDAEMTLFMGHLSEGESVQLIAQRRIGKTSLMHEASRRLASKVISVHVDLEKSASAEDAIVELGVAAREHASLWGHTKRILAGFAEKTVGAIETLKIFEFSLTLRSNLGTGDWRQKGDALLSAFAEVAERDGKPVVVFLDEVPILVTRMLRNADGKVTAEGRHNTDLFMSWLRDNVLRHRGKVAIVITGSIGIEPLLASVGLSGTLNAYRHFELKPWNSTTAKNCLLALAENKSLPLSDEAAAHMVKKLGSAIPHHVQMYFDHLHTTYVIEELQGDVTIEFANKVYAETLTGLRGHPELAHMEERLRLALSADRFAVGLQLLTEAAVKKKLTRETALRICATECPAEAPTTVFNEMVAILLHDGYIEELRGAYRFKSHLLRDWWRRRFGQMYKPVEES